MSASRRRRNTPHFGRTPRAIVGASCALLALVMLGLSVDNFFLEEQPHLVVSVLCPITFLALAFASVRLFGAARN